MPNKKRSECAISSTLDDLELNGQNDDNDQDDLALPGETLDEDEQLRLEINVDRALWDRLLASDDIYGRQALTPDPE